MGRRASVLAFVSVSLAACGARSPLIAPDVERDEGTDAPDASDVADAPAVGLPPVDPVCSGACPYSGLAPTFPPFAPLVRPDVPAECANGFELGGVSGGCGRATYTLASTRAGGARAVTLDVDFATYRAPDGVIVTGTDAEGRTYTLLQSCRLQTGLAAGPSTARPSDDTIRQFRLFVRPGTTQLRFDFGAVSTPMYMQVLGLCDFAVARFSQAAFWRAVP